MAPDLAKCPHCGALFFRHNHKGKEADSYGERAEWFKIPTAEDLISALRDGLPETMEEKITARHDLWWAQNSEIRRNEQGTEIELKTWQENCEALLELLLAKWANRRQRLEEYEIITLHITIMELHRNLGHF
jgi:hypothetical protein